MDREMAKWHDGTAGKRQAVADLEFLVKPLNDQACLRLVAALAMEWAEEWTTGKRYLDLELLNQ